MDFAIAGGVESMTRAPLVMGKAGEAFSRSAEIYDTTIGWRFINPRDEGAIRHRFHAGDRRERRRGVSGRRARTRTRSRCARSSAPARPRRPAISPKRSWPSKSPGGKAGPMSVDKDEHIRARYDAREVREAQAVRAQSRHHHRRQCVGRQRRRGRDHPRQRGRGARQHGLTPRARVLGMASAGVPPRIMGIGPVPSTRKLMERLGLKIGDFDLIELNEAFASQGIARVCASSASPTMPITSIRMAARSRLAIRSACPARGSRLPRCTAWKSAAASARSPPCASALARACRWRWRGFSVCYQPSRPMRPVPRRCFVPLASCFEGTT